MVTYSCVFGVCGSDPLPRAVYLAYKARKSVLGQADLGRLRLTLRQCDRSGRLLRESLKLVYPEEEQNAIKVCVCPSKWRRYLIMVLVLMTDS